MVEWTTYKSLIWHN